MLETNLEFHNDKNLDFVATQLRLEGLETRGWMFGVTKMNKMSIEYVSGF